LRGKQKRLVGGEASLNGSSHLLQTSERERGGQTEVDRTGTPIQRAVDIPGLDALTLAEFARGAEATMQALKREGGQAREPLKPCGRIGDEGKDALSRSNEHVATISSILNESKRTRVRAVEGASDLGCGRRSGVGRRGNRDGFGGEERAGGRGGQGGGSRNRECGAGGGAFTQQCQSEFSDLLLKSGHLRVE
jgi:hypothetical protein